MDGTFVGSTPSTLPLTVGLRQVTVRSGDAMWQRNLQVTSGSTVTLKA